MNAMKNKIKSQRGASITFALLLFLVCAVISSVVIVAATAAGGRMSQIAQSDQRYYAVTSAAELLKDALDGKTVTVRTTEKSKATTSYNDGTVVPGTPEEEKKESIMTFDGDDTTTITLDEDTIKKLSVIGDAAYRVADAEYNENKTSDAHLVDGVTLVDMPRKLSLTAKTDDDSTAGVFSVDMREELSERGTITFYVSKKDGTDATGKNAYTLKLSFKADVKTTVDTKTNAGTPTNVANGGLSYDVIETTDRITETNIQWTLLSITKSTMPG